jgi:hypothetical protein
LVAKAFTIPEELTFGKIGKASVCDNHTIKGGLKEDFQIMAGIWGFPYVWQSLYLAQSAAEKALEKA